MRPMTDPESPVRYENRGRLGVITLNRPKAVNALTQEMLHLIGETLDAVERDPDVTAVAVTGAGDRGLCAGGDIVALHRAATGGDPSEGVRFFRVEYALDHRISSFPKPYLPIMSGLVLGGGVGISAPGSHRIATDSTRTGMPETGIGFSPDVGGLHFLARAPGLSGTHLALTGGHIDGADALHVGLADHYVSDAAVPGLLAALETAGDAEEVGAIVGRFDEPAPAPALREAAPWIDRTYDADTVEEIVQNLHEAADGHDADEPPARALAALRRHSPTGLKTALEGLRRAPRLSLAQTLEQDFRTSCHALAGHDLAEGIRAQVVDKDRNPRWRPATLEKVSREAVLAFFEPVPGVPDLNLTAEEPS